MLRSFPIVVVRKLGQLNERKAGEERRRSKICKSTTVISSDRNTRADVCADVLSKSNERGERRHSRQAI